MPNSSSKKIAISTQARLESALDVSPESAPLVEVEVQVEVGDVELAHVPSVGLSLSVSPSVRVG